MRHLSLGDADILFYVLAFSGVLYVFWTILRILFYGIRSLFLKKEMRPEDDQDSVT